MKTFRLVPLSLAAAGLVSLSCAKPAASPAAECIANARPKGDIGAQLAKFRRVDIPFDSTGLTAREVSMVRKLVDVYLKRRLAAKNLTEDEIIAETDKSHGVLLASGYIAGGAIAGILIAIFAVVPALNSLQNATAAWAKVSNPFFAGDTGWWLGAVPFLILAVLLYLVGREKLMKGGGDLE